MRLSRTKAVLHNDGVFYVDVSRDGQYMARNGHVCGELDGVPIVRLCGLTFDEGNAAIFDLDREGEAVDVWVKEVE